MGQRINRCDLDERRWKIRKKGLKCGIWPMGKIKRKSDRYMGTVKKENDGNGGMEKMRLRLQGTM